MCVPMQRSGSAVTKLLLWGSALLAGILSGCGADKKGIDNADREVILQSIANDVIVPAFKEFELQTDSLLLATTAFTSHPEPATLQEVRARWKATAYAWKRASTYSFGPVEDNFLSGSIDYPSVHYPNIEKSIVTHTPIDQAYISSRGTSLKGIKAIEYLLFKNAGEQPVISEFKASAPRREYLLALVTNLNLQAQKAVGAWRPYAQTFIDADGNDIKSAISVLINRCVSQINMVKDERLAMPLGMRSQGELQIESVEGRLSGTSIELLKNEIFSIRACVGLERKQGILALLDQLDAAYDGKPLSEAIDSQFREIDRLADKIQQPLETAIINETESVTALYTALKKLQILLEVDVVNQLGIILTFSDNDGD
jgi:predicted lipoprotein